MNPFVCYFAGYKVVTFELIPVEPVKFQKSGDVQRTQGDVHNLEVLTIVNKEQTLSWGELQKLPDFSPCNQLIVFLLESGDC